MIQSLINMLNALEPGLNDDGLVIALSAWLHANAGTLNISGSRHDVHDAADSLSEAAEEITY